MQTITMEATEAHDFASFEDAEAVASQWNGAEVQVLTYPGNAMSEDRTVYHVILPVPHHDYRVGFVALKGF